MMVTELEYAILGFVWREGRCSAYAIKRVFELVSTGWSSSPGSIYPSLARLQRAGLVESTRQRWGMRQKTLFEITDFGRERLSDWVIDVPDWAGRPPIDPIRTKCFFLDLLKSQEDRLAFVVAAEASTRIALERLQLGTASLDEENFSFDRLAQAGGIFQLNARLEWLAVIRRELLQRKGGPGEL